MPTGKTSFRHQLSQQLVSESSREIVNRNLPPWPEWNDTEINAVEWDPNPKTKGKESKISKILSKSAVVRKKSAEKDLVEVSICCVC